MKSFFMFLIFASIFVLGQESNENKISPTEIVKQFPHNNIEYFILKKTPDGLNDYKIKYKQPDKNKDYKILEVDPTLFNAIKIKGETPDPYGNFYELIKTESSLDVKAGWLIGKWKTKGTEKTTIEEWKKLGNYTYEGISKIVDKKGVTSGIESLRLVEMGNDIFYIAKVDHNEYPIPFKLTQFGDDFCLFENPGHDFPKSLKYIKIDHKQMKVEVRGDEKGFDGYFEKSE